MNKEENKLREAIDASILKNIINAAIYYGGDKGGPYFDDNGKTELIAELDKNGLKPVFSREGLVENIERK